MFAFKRNGFKTKSLKETPQTNEGDLKEKLFFHDIINQTHGLLLFFGQKELSQESIEGHELKMLASEIKTLQSLIRDHYNFRHKNLSQTMDWVSFSYAELSFAQLSMTYLNDVKVSSSFKMELSDVEDVQIYYPCFYRIMNNLIKNMAEAQAESVEFEFTLKESGLFIKTKNIMKTAPEKDLSECLPRVNIEEKNSASSGLGLESIHHLAEDNGGSFSFEIFDNTWVNRLFLPVRKKESSLKIAA